MYSPTMGRDMAGEYISQTGMDTLQGADILSTALDYSIRQREIRTVEIDMKVTRTSEVAEEPASSALFTGEVTRQAVVPRRDGEEL